MNRRPRHPAWILVALALPLGACGGGSAAPHPGGAGSGGGAAGSGAVSGAAGAGAGASGSGPAGAGGLSGAAGDAAGAAGANGNGAAGAGGTVAGGAGGGGVAGAAGQASAGANGADAAAGTTADAGAPRGDAATSSRILIYGVTTGFRHGSITPAANAIAQAAATFGLTAEQVGCTDATNHADATKFTAAALAQYGAVILLANSGEPFGYPATAEIQNLVDYVQHGGALIAIEDADHCYDGQFNGHPASQPYVNLVGNDFVGHPGGVAPATCTKMGTQASQASVAQLPATFSTTDEIYATTMFRMDNQVVLTCVSSGDGTKTMRPVSYVREEGAGRVFYTALGHDDARWTAPMDATAANSRLVQDHVVPALLWAMRR
jgi:type 1 glutamine amidotransferase